MSEPYTPHELLDFLHYGFKLFPLRNVSHGICSCGKTDCASPGKHPATARGFYDATDDAERIAAWWSSGHKNFAAAIPPNLIVVDIDPRNGGDDSWLQLKGLGEWPDTIEVLTGGGGRHIYLSTPGKQFRKAPLKGFAGIDIVALGGYVVIPPSIHKSGRSYEFESSSDMADGIPIAEAPAWLCQLLDAKPAGDLFKERPVQPEPERFAAPADELEEVKSALAAINADLPYPKWIQVGQALNASLWLEAFEIWSAWCATGEKYPGDAELRRKWATFNANGAITLRTVFAMAKEAGWGQVTAPVVRRHFKRTHMDVAADNSTFTRFLIAGTIQQSGIVVLGGEPNLGKSAIAMDWAASVALGLPWNGLDVRQAPVVYVAQEARGEMGQRARAWRQQHGRRFGSFPFFLLDEYVDFSADGECAAFAADIAGEFEQPFVIIDTLAASMPGAQENESPAMSKLLVNIRQHLIDEARATVLLVHHSPKANRWDLRGWGGLRAAVDGVLMVGLNDDGNKEMRWNKQREGRLLEPMPFETAGITLHDKAGEVQLDDFGNPVSSVVINWGKGVELDVDVMLVREKVATSPNITKRALRAAIKARATVVDGAIERAMDAQLIRKTDAGYVVTDYD